MLHVCDKIGGNFVNEHGPDILADLIHTQEEINFVCSISVKQWKSKEWYKQKSGFITGSIAQQCMSMQNSLDKGLKRKVLSVVDKITNQQACFSKLTICENSQNPRDWGLKHEESAWLSYYKVTHLHTRVSEHLGISPKTGKPSSNPPMSSIFSHLKTTGHTASFDDFQILCSCLDDCELMIHESLLISKLKPTLNVQGNSIPLNLL